MIGRVVVALSVASFCAGMLLGWLCGDVPGIIALIVTPAFVVLALIATWPPRSPGRRVE
jgi:hypothetical protein